MNDQIVAVVLNPFQKLASVRRLAKGNGAVTMNAYYNRAYQADTQDGNRAIYVALRKHPRDEWCHSVVSSDLTVTQANDIIRHINRGYIAQGYKLLQNEKLV